MATVHIILGAISDEQITQRAWSETPATGVATTTAVSQDNKDQCNDKFIINASVAAFIDIGSAPDGTNHMYMATPGEVLVIPAKLGDKVAWSAAP